jgi:hypothetical protein
MMMMMMMMMMMKQFLIGAHDVEWSIHNNLNHQINDAVLMMVQRLTRLGLLLSLQEYMMGVPS